MSDLASALGRIPSGIFILTAKHEGKSTGMLASWVMQAAFDPPMFSVAVRKDRYLAEWLIGGASVTLNILAEDEKEMISHFGHGFGPDEDAFEGLELLDEGDGTPILAEALGYLQGSVVCSMETGDHILFAVTIQSGRLLRDGSPMTHIRKDGLKY